jgi:hypothetical protein
MTGKSQTRWLWEPALSGRRAFLFVILAVALPTAVRAAINGSVTGCEFTPYLPFVLLTAIIVGWWQAGLVALASVGVLGGLFVRPVHGFLTDDCAVSAAGVFLASSVLIIFVVLAVRRLITIRQRNRAAAGDVIFSLEEGEVWASWRGAGPPMSLGKQEQVEEMMEDFLAQGELGKRLNEMGK